MLQAISQAGWQTREIDYINAHATSTLVGDRAEASAITAVLGADLANVTVSATKSMTGHMVGAAGAIEAAICARAITEGLIPPTINLQDIDPLCKLNHVANQALHKSVRRALSNSFGYGGHNTSLALQGME
jgi:3-oxoacyl-(acyl-carrier-protein) synthase